MSRLSKFIYRFNVISIKLLVDFVLETDRMILKFTGKSQNNFEIEQSWRLILPDLQTFYKTAINQWFKSIWSNDFWQRCQVTQWRKEKFSPNGIRTIGYLHANKRISTNPYTMSHTKFNSTWTTGLNVKPKIIKLLEENGTKLLRLWIRQRILWWDIQYKTKTDKLDFIKIIFCSSKDTFTNEKKPQTGRKYL